MKYVSVQVIHNTDGTWCMWIGHDGDAECHTLWPDGTVQTDDEPAVSAHNGQVQLFYAE